MLLNFFVHLRESRLPVSIREWLDLLRALRSGLAVIDLEKFYFLARLCLVKDEKYYDRFNLAFDSYFTGLDAWDAAFEPPANSALLRRVLERLEVEAREADVDELLAEYREWLDKAREAGKQRERESRQQDEEEKPASNQAEGEEWRPDPYEKSGGREPEGDGDGDGDESGDGDEGEEGQDGDGETGEKGRGKDDEPGEGERSEVGEVSHRTALKVWQLRDYADYDPETELGTRNIKLALRRLRKFARTSAELELDLADTIRTTARNGGILEIIEVPERHNAVKVLLFLDVGGSMDEHVELCAQLFAAARSEFKYLEYFYFHNFIYESVWHHNDRRHEDRASVFDLIHKFGSDYKIIFVGDASMGQHEIQQRGGSVEHYNAEPGEVWLARLQERFRKIIWLNPVAPGSWDDIFSIQMIQRRLDNHMYHLSVDGIEQAMKYLAR